MLCEGPAARQRLSIELLARLAFPEGPDDWLIKGLWANEAAGVVGRIPKNEPSPQTLAEAETGLVREVRLVTVEVLRVWLV